MSHLYPERNHVDRYGRVSVAYAAYRINLYLRVGEPTQRAAGLPVTAVLFFLAIFDRMPWESND